ncbi:MAG TPA: iron ABC transporter permease, partial [Methylibium sp.]|nr:iron ABC transporter permease [Methylibium sp.]
ALAFGSAGLDTEMIRTLRAPRVAAAAGVGALLALSGLAMQSLLRNPLADPYVLGVSGGAAVGALGAMVLGLGALLVQLGALAGALLSIALVFALAHRDLARLSAAGSADTAPRLLLTGVMLAAGWSAVITLMLAVAPEAQVRGMLFWLAGDLSAIESVALPLAALAVVLLVGFPAARELNVLLRGPAVAATLGVRVAPLQRRLYLLASLASAVAVTTAGSIGFVGLVVPHALRLVAGNDQRVLLPACALAGGALLVLADTLARSIVAPQQLPVGVITALVGVPTFLVLLMRRGAPR